MILLVDLDGTLVDRRAAFRTWALAFVDEQGGDAGDTEWLLREDADPRRAVGDVAGQVRPRSGGRVPRGAVEHGRGRARAARCRRSRRVLAVGAETAEQQELLPGPQGGGGAAR